LVYHAFTKGADIATMAKAVWDENTQAIFSAIVGFWFGNRMLVRGQEHMAATAAVTNPPPVVVAKPSHPAPAAPPPARRSPEAAVPRSGIIPPPPGDRS
jgi:hypothetical protein